ncbi:MAG: SAM-dependent methyltransferase, partial [Gemmatimonadota bacterium]
MACTCGSLGCADVFGSRLARREADRFRRRGLDRRSHALLDALAARVALAGKTAIEVGAGAGGLTISMIERGVARVAIIDAAPAYIEAASRLAAERGVADALSAELGNYA